MYRKLSMLMVAVMLFSSLGLTGVAASDGGGAPDRRIQLEELDRGLVAALTAEGVFLSWRLLSHEVSAYSDYGLRGTDFNVYRNNELIATVDKSTNYLDEEGTISSEYRVSALVGGVETDRSDSVTPWANPYYDLPLQRPAPGVTPVGETYGYHANDMSVGDVNGDGQYEYIVKWEPTNSKDVSQRGYTGSTYIDAYTLDGTLLYRIDLGVNIRSGAHYTQFMVYDFDGDGKAELIFKTAPGTRIVKYDNNGTIASETYITMPQEDIDNGYRHSDDYRLSSQGYYDHLVDMFMGWHEHEEVVAGNWPATIEAALNAEDEFGFDYPLSREDAETLADYFIDVYAPARSGNNQLRNFEGFILSGPEYLTVFDGETGDELQTIHYKPGRGDDGLLWGDYAMARIEPGNRVDRFLAAVAYLDGEKPSAVFARGYYTRTTLVAYDWDGSSLRERWFVDSGHAPMSNPFNDGPHGVSGSDPEYGLLTTQGFHSLSTADVDGDGRQEIVYGSATIDDDGSLLYSSFDYMPDGSAAPGEYARLGHGDAMHVADIDPDRPGLEIFTVHEGGTWAPYGYALRDAATGEVLFGGYTGRDTGRGMVGDVVRGQRGLETWAVDLRSAGGAVLGSAMPGTNMSIRWAADMTTQMVNGSIDQTPTIDDWERGRQLTATDTRTNNYTKGNPSLVADIFGDWREELLVRKTDSSAIRIFLSTEVTDRKLYTLMHDIQYRTGIAWQNTTYNQPAYPSFYFASDIDWSKVPVPNAGPLEYIEEEPTAIDKTPLAQLIDEAKAIGSGGYTPDSWQQLQDAIAAAEAALATIVTETQLQAALIQLRGAIDALVEDIDWGPGWRFDFGGPASPVANGYVQVTDTTLYSEETGFGFAAAADGFRDQGAPDDLRRDFVLAHLKQFVLDMPDGDYDVRIVTGAQNDANDTSYSLEGGEWKGGIRTPAGEFMEYADTVIVSDGQLNIDFQGSWARINAVVVTSSGTGTPIEPIKFDFGSAASPVAEGYTQVTNTMVYDEARGFGVSQAVDFRDRGEPDDLRRDFIIGGGYSFMADLPGGSYFLRIIAGDNIAFNRTSLAIEGVSHGSISSQSGQFAELTAMVTVEDGQLNIDIGDNGRINALEIIPMSAIDSLELAAVRLVPQTAVELQWNAEPAASYYNVYRQTAGQGEFALIGTADDAAYTDLTAELGLAYTYRVALVTADGLESAPSNSVTAVLLDETASPPTAPTGVTVTAAEAYSVALAWDESEDAALYYVYRARYADGPYARIGTATEAAYTDASVSTYNPLYYKVRAVNEGGFSGDSEPAESPIANELLRRMERLDRALVAVMTEDGVYVGWRMLGTDPESVAFNLYRDGVRINESPIRSATNYLDPDGTADSEYQLRVLGGGIAGTVGVWDRQYWSIPLDKPADGVTPAGEHYTYTANDASVGDLDGDGEYEIILKWEPSNAQDNSRAGYTGNVYIDAYKLDGTRLWRIDAGRNIRAGAHYTQFLVYDLDGDGKAEIVLKTADGTVDGEGTAIGDPDADWRNSSGYVLAGPEFLTVFAGETGKALHTVDYYPPRGNVSDWGDNYGNRVDRFLAAVAYLDGERPSIVMARGYYTRAVLAAYDFIDGELVERWVFDSDEPGNAAYAGQGNHNLAVADVDGDGFDEIIYGASVIDHDGTGLYSTGWGHGDALHVSDLNPNRPGLEIYQPHESSASPYGFGIRDAETGESLWGVRTGSDVGRGLAADIDPRHDGAELWASNSWDGSSGGSGLFTVEGELIAERTPKSINHAVWWDGDLLRELLDHDFNPDADPHGYGKIDKWNWETEELERLYTPEGTRTNNHTKGNPSLQADLFGDWREEVVWPSSDSTELQIHTTVDVTEHRIYTLMHDPTYRLAVAWQNVAYNQPPHPGFYLGEGMDAPPAPRIVTGDSAPVDLTELLDAIDETKRITNADNRYTAPSYQALLDAIAEVEASLDTIASQTELEAAAAALEEAIAGLALRPADPGTGPGSGPGTGPGAGSDSGSDPAADNGQMVIERYETDANNEMVVALEPNTREILLPADADAVSQPFVIRLAGEGFEVQVPSALLKRLLDEFAASSPSAISFKLEIFEEEEESALLDKASARSGANVRAAGRVVGISLALLGEDDGAIEPERFSPPIAVSFDVDAHADAAVTGIYLIGDNGEPEYIGGKRSGGRLTADIDRSGRYAALEYDKTFADVAASHWAREAIRALAARQVATGVDANRFAPDRDVTRAEFAALTVRILKLDSSAEAAFRDVDSSSWYAREVAAAFEAGIVTGRSSDRFAPEATITREEMAVMLARAYRHLTGEQAAAASGRTFVDQAQISSWAQAAVSGIRELGLIQGRGGNRFAPQAALSRAESIQALYNLLARIELQ